MKEKNELNLIFKGVLWTESLIVIGSLSIPLGLWLLWIHIAFKKEPYVKASNIFKVNRAFVPSTLQCQGKLRIFYQSVSSKNLVWQFWTSKGIYIYK